LNIPNKSEYDETVEEDGRIDGTSFVHTNNNNNKCTVTIDPIIENGIAKLEFLFKGHDTSEFSIAFIITK
jgi:hypothetical protein